MPRRYGWMWIAIALISLASLIGYVVLQNSPPGVVAFVLAFAIHVLD